MIPTSRITLDRFNEIADPTLKAPAKRDLNQGV
jgi:hypothetical protein